MGDRVERYREWTEKTRALHGLEQRDFLKTFFERAQLGCLVFALESAFSVKATDEEWNMRIADSNKIIDELRPKTKYLNNPEVCSLMTVLITTIDRIMIRDYLNRLRTHD